MCRQDPFLLFRARRPSHLAKLKSKHFHKGKSKVAVLTFLTSMTKFSLKEDIFAPGS